MIRTDILEKNEEIINWINEYKSKAYICRQLKCKPITLEQYLTKMGLEYKGNQGGVGKKDLKRKSALEYSKSIHVSSHKLRIKLIEDGIKKEECESCELNEWLGRPIPLELHHIDGNRFNNEFENLQILCSNCHSLTDNYGSKNKKKKD